MKRFYLFCDAGMSTSLLANRMQKVAEKNKLPIEVKAFSSSQMDAIVKEINPDVILLGPQVKHLLEKVRAKYESTGTPILVIDAEDYGAMDGERVLKKALLALRDAKGKN